MGVHGLNAYLNAKQLGRSLNLSAEARSRAAGRPNSSSSARESDAKHSVVALPPWLSSLCDAQAEDLTIVADGSGLVHYLCETGPFRAQADAAGIDYTWPDLSDLEQRVRCFVAAFRSARIRLVGKRT